MEIGVKHTNGLEQAFRRLEAMEGQDEATRRSLWRAALRYRRKGIGGDARGLGNARASCTAREDQGSSCAW